MWPAPPLKEDRDVERSELSHFEFLKPVSRKSAQDKRCFLRSQLALQLENNGCLSNLSKHGL